MRSRPDDTSATVDVKPNATADGTATADRAASPPTIPGGGNGDRPPPARVTRPPQPPRPPEGRRRPKLRKLRVALVLLGLSVLAFVSWVFGIMMAVAQDLPSLENREQYQRAENSVVYDINGERLATLTNNEGRILVSSDQIAPTMKDAVVAIEDQRFYHHRGVDFEGIGRALYQDILSGSPRQGGSTITQQFVKNALAAQDSRTILQKLREAALAYHLERQWSKDKILTEYLNSIYFGEGAYGIEAAARTYFGNMPGHEGCGEGPDAPTCASELLPWEAALLAGIISSPSAYSPRANPDAAIGRRNLVLQNMAEQGYITEEEYAEYSQEEIPGAADIQPREEDSEAPYFTSWLRQQLVDLYGAGEAFGGGLHVYSTLDLDLQRAVEDIVYNRLAAIEPTSSVVVLDNDTGGVRAMVGGPDYEKRPFNLATQGHRQPGSAFKPFTLVTALSEGISSSAVYESAPQQIAFEARVKEKGGGAKAVTELFEPKNYEDSYLGSASVAAATTYSDNSVYAQLGTQAGPGDVAETAGAMGIQTDLSTDVEYRVDGGEEFEPYNPALILGGLEVGVTPLEMAHAYETLATDGRRISGTLAASEGGPVAIQKVVDDPPGDEDADVVETVDGTSGENRVVDEQVIDSGVAAEAKSILATVVSSGTGTNAATGEQTWGKTGTTDNNGDAWFCGATDEITACVWVGHPDSVTPMTTEFAGQPVDGGTYPALIFHDIVLAYEGLIASRGDDEDEDAGAPDEDAEEDSTDAAPTDSAPAPTDTAPAPTEPAPPTDEGDAATAPAPEEAAAPESSAPSGGAPAPTEGGVTPE